MAAKKKETFDKDHPIRKLVLIGSAIIAAYELYQKYIKKSSKK